VRTRVAGTVVVAIVAIVAPAAFAGERAGCPRPPVHWQQKKLLPVVEGDGFKGVVLPAKAATAVLCQCSRSSLGVAARYWTPTADDIAQLEARLPDYLGTKAHRSMPNQWRRLGESLRQYLGVERAGRKLIHVNVLGGEAFSLARRPFKRSAIERAWRSTAFNICDGGPDFFGAEYDVAAGKFTRIDFNL
jgi:hypothetical protein